MQFSKGRQVPISRARMPTFRLGRKTIRSASSSTTTAVSSTFSHIIARLITVMILFVLVFRGPQSTAYAWALDDDELTESWTSSGKSDIVSPRLKYYSYLNYLDDEEPRVTITGVLGGKVGLPCNIQPNSSDDEVSLVLWYKDDSTTPIYSLDSRKTTLRNAHHAPAQWLSGRAYLQATSGTVSTPRARVDDDVSSQLRRGLPTNSQLTNRFGGTNNRSGNTDADRTSASAPGSSLELPAPSLLQLDPLEKEDEALYRCRVDFRRARTRNYEVQLIVVVPPQHMTVTDHHGAILADKAIIGPYNEGEKLVLKCQVYGGNPTPKAVWYRTPKSSPNYINGAPPHGRVSSDNNRSSLKTQNLGFSLHNFGTVIASSSPAPSGSSDSGPVGAAISNGSGSTEVELVISTLTRLDLLSAFACVAQNNNISEPLVFTVVVDVYFRPQRVWISTMDPPAPGSRDGDASLTLSAGVPVRLQCSSSGSRPPAVIQWFKGDERINATKSFNVSPNPTTGIAVSRLKTPEEEIAGPSSANSREAAATPAKYRINLSPADEPWRQTLSTIELIPSPDDDGKQLVCRAENPSMPSLRSQNGASGGASRAAIMASESAGVSPRPGENGIDDGIKLHVRYVPQMTVRLGTKLRHTHIREGSDVFLECDVKANPPLIEMGWRFEGQELTPTSSNDNPHGHNNHKGVVIIEHSLVLQKVTRHNRGKYTCTGTNAVGQGESDPLQLRVKYEPRCMPGQRQVYGAAKNEAVRLSCELESDPEEVTFKWKTRTTKRVISFAPYSASNASPNNASDDDRTIPDANLNLDTHGAVVSNGTRSWLTLIPRSEEDYGTVICWGKNTIGTQKEPCMFTLIPAGPPGPVHNCTIAKATEDSLTIACLEGYDGGAEYGQHFHMEVHDSANQNRVLIANVTSGGLSAKPVLTAAGLSPSTAYVCTIYAANERGTSQPTILVASTIPRPFSLSKSSKGGYSFLFGYLYGNGPNGNNNPSLLALFGLVTALVTTVAVVALIVLLTLKLVRCGQFAGGNNKKYSKKAPHEGISRDDDESVFPLRDPNKERDHMTDLKIFGNDLDDDSKCPDIITGDVVESSFISSVTPLSHFSSSAAAASLSMALQQMQQQSSYATAAGVRESLTACLHSPNEWIPTDSKKNVGPSATRSSIITGLYQLGVGNRRNSLKRSSWDLAQQQKLQPSYMSCQHVATLPRKPTHQNVQSSHHQEQQSQYGSSPPPKQNANFDVSLPSMLPVGSCWPECPAPTLVSSITLSPQHRAALVENAYSRNYDRSSSTGVPSATSSTDEQAFGGVKLLRKVQEAQTRLSEIVTPDTPCKSFNPNNTT
ncbi:uncharacterized protein LOC111243887 isoform X2 [Varroa destructor]|uniref:Nephrin n=1 Tax=Varroa destructor TaxID=109461 RepID=A0A7M7J260_VARDE|nr:uncharacterized protein LOC111243887 isoform X2 [Varroa destructor]